MNNTSLQIKQIARKLFKAKTGAVHVKILHPKRDWFLGVGIAACIVVGITIWNGYTYFSNRDGGVTDTEITIANPRYQAELVDQALGVFSLRSNDFNAISTKISSLALPIEEGVATDTATSTATSTTQSTSPTLEEEFVDSESQSVESVDEDAPEVADDSVTPVLTQ